MNSFTATLEIGGFNGLIATIIIRAKIDARDDNYEHREAAQQWLYDDAPALLQAAFDIDPDAARVMLLDLLTMPDEPKADTKARNLAIRKERKRNEREARATYDINASIALPKRKKVAA